MVLPRRQLPILLSLSFVGSAMYIYQQQLSPMNLNDINLTDSEINEYFKQMKNENQTQEFNSNSDLQVLIENTLHLQYQIFLTQEELKYFKITIAEKDCEVKRLKEKLHKKNNRITALNDSIKKLNKKAIQIKEGYKKISNQNKEYSSNQQKQRSQRLTYQQKKTKLYQKYCELQQNYSNTILQIEQYGEVVEQQSELKIQNEELIRQIQDYQQRKKGIISDQAIDKKEHLKHEIKKMYQKIKMTEKEDQNICQQYQSNRKALNELQRTQNSINNKNFQIENLYYRIERLKQEVKTKRWQKSEKQRQFFELSHEQTVLRKEVSAQAQFRSSQAKTKEQKNHNFKIIDSEADEDVAKTGEKLISHYQSCNLESQQQLDQLINRFQKIKSKSKNI